MWSHKCARFSFIHPFSFFRRKSRQSYPATTSAKVQPVVFALVLLALNVPTGAEEIYPCDANCTGKFSAAMRIATGVPNGTVFSVIDLNDWTAATYRADQFYRFGEYIERAVPIPTTSNALKALGDLKRTVHSIQSGTISIPGDIARNAHEVVASSQAREAVARYLDQNQPLFTSLGSLTGALLRIFNKIVDVNFYVPVEFEDGSTARFEVTGLGLDENNGIVVEFALQDGSATDSDGNNIPDSEDRVIGERFFNSEANQQLFARVADLFGASFRTGGCKTVNATVCVKSETGFSCTTFTVCK